MENGKTTYATDTTSWLKYAFMLQKTQTTTMSMTQTDGELQEDASKTVSSQRKSLPFLTWDTLLAQWKLM